MTKMFKCPVKETRLTSKFGWRDIGRGKEWHQGVDLAGPKPGEKVNVYAAASGKVTCARIVGTYGNSVRIVHRLGGRVYETNYAHLHTMYVKPDQDVVQGQLIGLMGNTGGSFGVHLHFEIHDGRYAPKQPNAVDPMKYISLDDWKAPVVKEETKPVEKDDDIMKFSNETTKLVVRDHIKQMVKKGHVAESWLTKFDNGTVTTGDYDGLKLISEQKAAEEAKKK